MTGIVIDMNPVAFQLGPLAVRWYGLALALALAVGLVVAQHEARRKGIVEDEVYAVAFWAILGALVGARIFHALDELDYYLSHPWEALAFQEGGLSMWGGLAGGLLGGWLYLRRHELPLAPLLDAAAPALLVGQAIGRLGCIVNGDAYGRLADLPWAFTYINPDALIPTLGVPTHPYPVYEIAWNLAVLAVLWPLRRRLRVDGLLFLAYAGLYGLGRFALGYTRQGDAAFLGLQPTQILSLAALVAAILWTTRLLQSGPERGREPDSHTMERPDPSLRSG